LKVTYPTLSVTVSTSGDITFGVLGKAFEAEQLNIIPTKRFCK